MEEDESENDQRFRQPHQSAAKGTGYTYDREKAYAAVMNFSPQRLAELIDQAKAGQNPFRFKEPEKGLTHLQFVVNTLALSGKEPELKIIAYNLIAGRPAVTGVEQPSQTVNNAQPQLPTNAQQQASDHANAVAVAAQAGLSLTPIGAKAASRVADVVFSRELAAAQQKQQVPSGPPSPTDIANQSAVATEAGLSLTPIGAKAASRVADVVFSRDLAVAQKAQEQAQIEAAKKKQQQPPVAPPPTTPTGPSIPAVPGIPPGIGSSGPTPPAPGNTAGEDAYKGKYPQVPPSGEFPDKFITFVKGDP